MAESSHSFGYGRVPWVPGDSNLSEQNTAKDGSAFVFTMNLVNRHHLFALYQEENAEETTTHLQK